jgi:excisionase family DNA binding protein
MEGEGNYYTVEEAARVLKRTPGRIRQMLRAGELEGVPPDESEGRGWKIPAHAVHDRDRPARVERPSEARSLESPERLQDLEAEVRDLRYELGLSRGRLELTEKTESTLREQLERERERADKERERAEQLQAELEEARRPWWRRMFGG